MMPRLKYIVQVVHCTRTLNCKSRCGLQAVAFVGVHPLEGRHAILKFSPRYAVDLGCSGRLCPFVPWSEKFWTIYQHCEHPFLSAKRTSQESFSVELKKEWYISVLLKGQNIPGNSDQTFASAYIVRNAIHYHGRTHFLHFLFFCQNVLRAKLHWIPAEWSQWNKTNYICCIKP